MGDPLLPITNAGGFPVVHMTAPQAYIFDLKGWTCLPCLFTCYNTVNAKWGRGCPPPEVVEGMAPSVVTCSEESGAV